MWIRYLVHNLRSKHALHIGFYGGLVGILVDLDHPIAYALFAGQPTNAQWRFWHIQLGIVAGIIACYCLTCIGGLFYRMVLRGRAP